jgi:hypothetical protein
MPDFYPFSKRLADVDQVIAHLSITIGSRLEAASMRILEHLQIVLQACLEETPPQDIALVLSRPEHTAYPLPPTN